MLLANDPLARGCSEKSDGLTNVAAMKIFFNALQLRPEKLVRLERAPVHRIDHINMIVAKTQRAQ